MKWTNAATGKTIEIFNEDCLKTMLRISDDFIDLTITSPPYDNMRKYNGYSFEFEKIAKELYRITKNGGVVVWVVGDATIDGSETGTSFRQALYFKDVCGFNLHDTMIWEKTTIPQTSNRYEQKFEYMFILSKGKPKTFNPIMRKKIYNDKRTISSGQRNKDGTFSKLKFSKSEDVIDYNIWKIPTGGGIATKDKIAYKNPAIFPEKLVYGHIVSWSNENDIVYDPFIGSGTTAKIANKLNRNCIGSEISQEYCDIIKKRLNDHFNQLTLF